MDPESESVMQIGQGGDAGDGDVDVDVDKSSSMTHLLRIPDLVGEKILSYLDQPSLLTLRLVCHALKSWVEIPKHLYLIPIEIRTTKHYDRLITSQKSPIAVPWNNFTLSCSTSNPTNSYLEQDFLSLYAHTVRTLRLTFPKGFQRKFNLILSCPSLESLSIRDLSFQGLQKEDFKTLAQRFENLRDFRIEELASASPVDVGNLMSLIASGRQLEYLRLPAIPSELNAFHYNYSAEKFAETQKLLWLEQIVRPLTTYIRRRCAKTNKDQNQNQKNLKLRYIDLDKIFDMDHESFLELATVCWAHGVKILNTLFTNIIPHPTIPFSSYTSFKSIQSLNGFQPGKVSPELLENLQELTWSLGLCSLEDSSKESYEEELGFPKLRSLSVQVFSIEGEKMKEIINKLLVNAERPTVERLNLEWNLNTGSASVFIPGRNLAKSFPNLRVLELSKWGGGEEDFRALFNGLAAQAQLVLEELVLRDCKALSDKAFVRRTDDVGPSPFMRLQRLKKLWIRSFERGVTDKSLQEAFWKLPLQHLTLYSIGRSPITPQGFSGLTRAPFKNTIQYLRIDMVDVPFRRIRNGVNKFGNLKKFKF